MWTFILTERETRNLKQGDSCAALPVRIAVVASALISIFKWTQFLFESELKVKQLSRRMREGGRIRPQLSPISFYCSATQSPLTLLLLGPLSELQINFASSFREPKMHHRSPHPC